MKGRVAAIVGATCSGKTALALTVARTLNMPLINADSGLFYRDLSIGVAKPKPHEQGDVACYMSDFLEVDQKYNLADYLGSVRDLLQKLHGERALPLIVGGSGQYLSAIFEGWRVAGGAPAEKVRQEMQQLFEENGVEPLAAMLKRSAPEVAARTDLNNPRRVIRALERVKAGSEPPTKIKPPYDFLIIGIHWEKQPLLERVIARLEKMLAEGWLDETRRLMNKVGNDPNKLPPLIGYRELAAHLRGELALKEARERIVSATTRLIRHQRNWFKPDDSRITWLDGAAPNLVKRTVELMERFGARRSG